MNAFGNTWNSSIPAIQTCLFNLRKLSWSLKIEYSHSQKKVFEAAEILQLTKKFLDFPG
jgi:hypothetical protein